MRAARRGILWVAALLAAHGATARADDDDTASLFSAGVKALHDGRAADAIASLEALADRGLVDPVASFDRGLAYALRVRIGAEVPGDLGRAAHGFEEARDLARDRRLADDATRGLTTVRSEVARRRVRAGEPVEVDPGRSLARTMAALLAEDTWSIAAVVSSAALALGLFVRWLGRRHRVRVAGGVSAGVATPVLALAVVMILAVRHDRMHLHEGVIVVDNARPSDERGIALAGATRLPEGARVEVVGNREAWSRVRLGSAEAWVPSAAVRELARSP